MQEFSQSFLWFFGGQWQARNACRHLTCLHCTPTWILSLNVQISLGKFLVSKYHPCSQTNTTFFHCRCFNLMFQHLQIYDVVCYPVSPTLPLNWPDATYCIPQDALFPLPSKCKLCFLICSLTNWSLWTFVRHSNLIFQQHVVFLPFSFHNILTHLPFKIDLLSFMNHPAPHKLISGVTCFSWACVNWVDDEWQALLMFWGDFWLIVIRNRKKSEVSMRSWLIFLQHWTSIPLLIVRLLQLAWFSVMAYGWGKRQRGNYRKSHETRLSCELCKLLTHLQMWVFHVDASSVTHHGGYSVICPCSLLLTHSIQIFRTCSCISWGGHQMRRLE